MKNIRQRAKWLRINSPVSFGILCAGVLILVGGGAYALAAGVISPAVQQMQAAAATATPTVTPTETPVLVTPSPTDAPSPTPDEAQLENVTTTTNPETGEIELVDPNAPTQEPVAPAGIFSGKTIVIDAGKSKGGTHRGVSTKTYEYVINLAFAQALQVQLEALDATVVMTRLDNDKVVGANARINTINNAGADVAISLFCNDLDNATTRGAEAFVAKNASKMDESKKLAAAILKGYTGGTDMPTRTSDVRLVTNKDVLNGAKIPTMGLVLGQLSNKSDDANLNDTAFIETATRGIVNGLRSYFGL